MSRSPDQPTSSSLTSQSRAAAASSCAAALGVAGADFTQYPPVMPASSGAEATYTWVRAPCSGDSANGFSKGNNSAPNRPVSPSRPKLLATNPGCTALAVTPVSSQRRASSRVNRMLASLVLP